MASDKKQPEPPAQTVGEWIVTFSDCMTLLLCFFVLLLTFSSFDENAMQRFGGAFPFDHTPMSILSQRDAHDSMVLPVAHMIDHTRHGSRTPTDQFVPDPDRRDMPPKTDWVAEPDLHRNRKIIYIPSRELFTREGRILTAVGRRQLARLAGFMHELPCRLMISESSGQADGAARAHRRRMSLERAWAVMAYLTGAKGIPRRDFSLSATPIGSGARAAEPVVEIVVMTGKVHQ